VPAGAACERRPAAACCQPLLFIIYLLRSIIYLFIYNVFITYLLCSVCSGSMWEASYSSMTPAIIIYSFIINHFFIYDLFTTCYLLQRQQLRCVSCSNTMLAIIVTFIYLLLFIIYYLGSAAAARMRHPAAAGCLPL
jgi:hypothetical protein